MKRTDGWALLWMPLAILCLAFLLVSNSPVRSHPPAPPANPPKLVALTFDDGPSPLYTPEILQLLTTYNAHATFFVLGSEVLRFPQVAAAIARQGSVLANHGWQHLNLYRSGANVLWQDAHRAETYVRSLGLPMAPLYRPPYGNVSQTLLAIFSRHGYRVILWSLDTRDWAHTNGHVIAQKILHSIRPGSIVLMHDGGGDRAPTVSALATILNILSAQRYRFVTVPQLLSQRPSPQAPTLKPVT
ncbi:MAG: polysaccharide deacetylase family protein [Thermaerobacter sp.]|nr:polysaccharide deacetylase family protein [Thermaerobacter sp.]